MTAHFICYKAVVVLANMPSYFIWKRSYKSDLLVQVSFSVLHTVDKAARQGPIEAIANMAAGSRLQCRDGCW